MTQVSEQLGTPVLVPTDGDLSRASGYTGFDAAEEAAELAVDWDDDGQPRVVHELVMVSIRRLSEDARKKITGVSLYEMRCLNHAGLWADVVVRERGFDGEQYALSVELV